MGGVVSAIEILVKTVEANDPIEFSDEALDLLFPALNRASFDMQTQMQAVGLVAKFSGFRVANVATRTEIEGAAAKLQEW